jgi:hypothetical protein
MYYKEQSDRDFEFKLPSGESVKVHKLIVKHSSDEFRAKFAAWDKAGQTSITLNIQPIGPSDEISSKVLKIFVQYVYTGSFNWKELDDEGVLELLALADEFGFHTLACELGESVTSRQILNIWNVWYFYLAASKYELQVLHDSCTKFVDSHAIETLNNESCHELSVAMYKNIVSRDTLAAAEVEILKPMIRFLKVKDSEVSRDNARDLLTNIRWSFITKNEFDELVLTSGLVDSHFYENLSKKKELERFDSKNPRPQITMSGGRFNRESWQ